MKQYGWWQVGMPPRKFWCMVCWSIQPIAAAYVDKQHKVWDICSSCYDTGVEQRAAQQAEAKRAE